MMHATPMHDFAGTWHRETSHQRAYRQLNANAVDALRASREIFLLLEEKQDDDWERAQIIAALVREISRANRRISRTLWSRAIRTISQERVARTLGHTAFAGFTLIQTVLAFIGAAALAVAYLIWSGPAVTPPPYTVTPTLDGVKITYKHPGSVDDGMQDRRLTNAPDR